MSSDDTTSYPVEFLNFWSYLGFRKLELKVGVPVLLMRNLDAPRLCNDTRLRITKLGRHIVKATILTGEAKGNNVLIPRVPIIPNNLPFNFKWLQFPFIFNDYQQIARPNLKGYRHTFGMPCFPHGQLYVTYSSFSKSQNLHVYADEKNRLT
ncbi:ATP-dependent DNA helicase [Trichonephila clavipes]|nr:ATP-dependent DNA helicase [Trichonephila clavipes]